MTKINKSWREQRKAVVATDAEFGAKVFYISVWEAAKEVAEQRAIAHGTARREIRKAIKTGVRRYGFYWSLTRPSPREGSTPLTPSKGE